MTKVDVSPLSEFAIYDLYGDRDVIIPFPYPRKILVSENGLGKTTVLNALYAVLSGRFFKLENLEFREIVVTFPTDSVSIRKSDIEQLLQQEDYEGEYQELRDKIGKDELRKLVSLAREYSLESFKELKEIQHIANSLRIPIPQLVEKLKVLANDTKDKFFPLIQQVRNHFNFEVLYLTTYRRIEESLQSLGYSPIDLQLPSGLLQSGMDDVLERIEKVEGIAVEYQISKEELLNQFTNICNSYLIDKKIVYHTDTEQITLDVCTKKSRFIPLEALSSGEKQIISIFSHLYLSSPKKCAILIDEPELSISIEWQRKLLPDILKASKCQFLVVATHSPFIFENELATNTVDLQEYVQES
jgi:energy-coupling factor transporter ATP-binding protein EcfA2